MKTVLITGCSSGFGAEIARYFLDRDWRVIATMRTPRPDVLPASDRLRVLALDVTDADRIREAVAAAGPIDALVNNAGIGMLSILEDTPMANVRRIFETNTFGTMAMTQAVLPQFRGRKAGTVVNVTSSVTLRSLPMLSVYTASKAAVNAFTESLALELQPFNVQVKLVLPGRATTTAFGQNARTHMPDIPLAYDDFAKGVFERMGQAGGLETHALDVADAVWRAVTDPSCPMRLPAGADAVAWASSTAG